jgi:hypothetical protein
MALPTDFLTHLKEAGYHSRSDKHSKALSEAIVTDLMAYCPIIASLARAGKLVFSHNHDLTFTHSTWNTDLAIGTPPPGPLPGNIKSVAGMIQAVPASTRIAVEIKGVMTEHGKARKNRKRDLEAHHQHVHEYDSNAIAAGVMVVNASPTFQSPLRTTLTVHAKPPSELISMVANELNNVTTATGNHPHGLDAKCLIVVSMDNVNLPSTSYYVKPPAPAIGSPLHWDSFIQRICDLYSYRWHDTN